MATFKKAPTQTELLTLLRKGEVSFPPFSLGLRPELERDGSGPRPDAVIELGWNGRSRLFATEYNPVSTPAMIQAAVDQARRSSRPPLLWPMVLTPYLSEERLQELEREGVSGIDLCGNGVVTVPGQWLVSRTGRPNCYRQSFPIKNVFRGASSLVARVFLLRTTYDAVGEIQNQISRWGGEVTLSTVSKVLRRLEEELIVGRQGGVIRLLQPEKLLQRLVENYRPPKVTRRFLGKIITHVAPDTLLMVSPAEEASERRPSRVLTGASSVRRFHAEIPREPTTSFYCSDLAALLQRLAPDVREQDRFPDLELLETDDAAVYFDRCVVGGSPYASTVQTYLELATGGKREQEMAEAVKKTLLHYLAHPEPGLRL